MGLLFLPAAILPSNAAGGLSAERPRVTRSAAAGCAERVGTARLDSPAEPCRDGQSPELGDILVEVFSYTGLSPRSRSGAAPWPSSRHLGSAIVRDTLRCHPPDWSAPH